MIYRSVNKQDTKEMRFIAEVDSKIPLAYDRHFPWSEDSITDRLGYYANLNDDDHFEVAEFGSEIIGFHIIKAIPITSTFWAGSIVTLWVREGLRGKGIASNLKKRGEEWAKKRNLQQLQTTVHAQNKAMLAINEKSGFELSQYLLRKRL